MNEYGAGVFPWYLVQSILPWMISEIQLFSFKLIILLWCWNTTPGIAGPNQLIILVHNFGMLKGDIQLNNSREESSVRHQVRKLRAKVRTLIPMEICHHFLKRNERVSEINQLRKTKTSKDNWAWRTSMEKMDTYHVSNHDGKELCKSRSNFQFSELKPKEIEQINEDKNYFLGEKNVDAYNDFLKHLKSMNMQAQDQRNSTAIFVNISKSRIEHSTKSIPLRQSPGYNSLDRIKSMKQIRFRQTTHSSHIHTHQMIGNETRNVEELKWAKSIENIVNSNIKQSSGEKLLKKSRDARQNQRKSVWQKKKEIQEENKQKIIYHKMKMETNMKRAEDNEREIKYKKFFKFQKMANQQQERQSKVVKRKNLLDRKGQIVKLDEELRQLIIKRKKEAIQTPEYYGDSIFY